MTGAVRLVTAGVLPIPDADLPLLADGLRAHGVRVVVDDWRDPAVDWADTPVTVLRSPWDYVERVDEFVAWARTTAQQTQLWNPAELVAWNTHKAYLLDLHARGAPIVPTVVLLGGSAAALDGICDAQGWNRVVVKPAVGIGGIGGGRFEVGDPAGQDHLDALLAGGDVLVQPFASTVATDGEWSIVLFDGTVSHAVHKLPTAGEYRVHEEWGGRSAVAEPPAAAAELAARVVRVLPAPALYARIDLLRLGGQWHVLEVEATEPALWLDHAPPAATEQLVAAVMARFA